MDRFSPPSSPRSAGPATFAKHLRHRAPAIGLRRCHSSRQHVSASRWPLHRIPSRSPSANQTCSFNSTIPIQRLNSAPLGVGCSAFAVYLRSFLPITDLILSASLPLQHCNIPNFQPSPLPALRSPPSFDVRCSRFDRSSPFPLCPSPFAPPPLRPRFAALLFHDKIAMLARPFPPCRIFKPII